MEISPSDQTRIRYQFETYCKKIIEGERNRYFKKFCKKTKRETPFSAFSFDISEMFSTEHSDISNKYVFNVCGSAISIGNERLAECLLSLGEEGYSIILLAYFIGFNNREIGEKFDISRSAVQRKRSRLIQELKQRME